MHISIWEKLIVWWTAVDAQQQRIVHEKMHKATKKAFTWPRQNFEKPTLLIKSRQPQIGILTTKTCLFSRYETSSDLLNDLDCQKKAICEVYQNALELGEISKRARHSLDFLDSASVLSVPDEFLDIIDEFTVSYLNIKEMSQLTTVFENHPKSIIYTW